MTALALFASTFVLVFALGFQSLNVNNNHYWAAAMTSLVIGAMQMILLKLGPDASTLEIVAFIGGGPFGIVASMWAHRRTMRRKQKPDLTITVTADATQAIATLRAMTDGFRDIADATGDAVNKLERSNINCGADRP